MRRRLLFRMMIGGALGASALTFTPTGAQPAQPAAAATPAPAPFEIFTEMRDGTRLAANVYLPAGEGPWPVILTRTPYLKDGMFARPELAAKYTNAGYAFVVQDVRGKGNSEGFYAAFQNDIEDGYDSVEGIGRESWSDGSVGMSGASAMGITTNLAAMANPPSLKAAYVVVAPNETFNTSFPGGVPKDADNTGWLRRQGVAEEVIADQQARGATRSIFTDRMGPGESIRYIDIPIWNVGGWYDIFNTGSVENFEILQHEGARGARGNQRLTMGPFGHGELVGDLAYPGADTLTRAARDPNAEIRWFDHWLKGADNGIMDEAPVEYYLMASARKGAPSAKNGWRVSGDWPLSYREVRYYLAEDKSLSTDLPEEDSAKLSYKFDPKNPVKTYGGPNLTFEKGPDDQRQVGKRGDYLRFQTPVLDRDVVVAGPVTVELWGATDGPDTDFMAKLVDVYPDGYEALVLDAPIRARYRNGRGADDIEMMTPGAPAKMTIDLWNTAQVFEAGHRIAVHITSSNSPRFDVNRNNGDTADDPKLPRVATNSIYMDADHPSALVLPVVYLND